LRLLLLFFHPSITHTRCTLITKFPYLCKTLASSTQLVLITNQQHATFHSAVVVLSWKKRNGRVHIGILHTYYKGRSMSCSRHGRRQAGGGRVCQLSNNSI
jgi:hypothetical protein